MSKLAHSNDATMEQIERQAREREISESLAALQAEAQEIGQYNIGQKIGQNNALCQEEPYSFHICQRSQSVQSEMTVQALARWVDERQSRPRGRLVTPEEFDRRTQILKDACGLIISLEEALTPSADTKAAYIGEFSFNHAVRDQDGHEDWEPIKVPWTTVKEIMSAILGRAIARAHSHD